MLASFCMEFLLKKEKAMKTKGVCVCVCVCVCERERGGGGLNVKKINITAIMLSKVEAKVPSQAPQVTAGRPATDTEVLK